MIRYSRILFVFPKQDSFINKDSRTQRVMTTNVRSILGRFETINLPKVTFLEDVLCERFLEWSQRLSVVGNGDYSYICSNMTDYFSESYCYKSRTSIREDIISDTVKSVKLPDKKKCIDMIEYKTKRALTVHQRIRDTCNKVIEVEPIVVYLKAGTNFCNSRLGKTNVGDGLITIEADINTGKVKSEYSGISLDIESIITVLEGVANGI